MWDWIEKANELKKKNLSFVVATVVKNAGSTPATVGAKMIVLPGGTFHGTTGGGQLEHFVLKDAVSLFEKNRPFLKEYRLDASKDQLCGGAVEVYFELSGDNPDLYIFGAGHVGQALCKTMSEAPFKIHLIDEREEWVFSKNLQEGIIRHKTGFDTFIRNANFDYKKTFIAIMTPEHAKDQSVLECVLKKPFKYLGLLGSEKKWEELKNNLEKKGFSDKDFSKVDCPIGLPIGGKTPPEISISIASKIIKVFHGK